MTIEDTWEFAQSQIRAANRTCVRLGCIQTAVAPTLLCADHQIDPAEYLSPEVNDEEQPSDEGDNEAPYIDPLQIGLFDKDEVTQWSQEWRGMPEYSMDDLQPMKSVLVHFADSQAMAMFAEMVDQRITMQTRSLWYPKATIGSITDKRYADSLTEDGAPL